MSRSRAELLLIGDGAPAADNLDPALWELYGENAAQLTLTRPSPTGPLILTATADAMRSGAVYKPIADTAQNVKLATEFLIKGWPASASLVSVPAARLTPGVGGANIKTWLISISKTSASARTVNCYKFINNGMVAAGNINPTDAAWTDNSTHVLTELEIIGGPPAQVYRRAKLKGASSWALNSSGPDPSPEIVSGRVGLFCFRLLTGMSVEIYNYEVTFPGQTIFGDQAPAGEDVDASNQYSVGTSFEVTVPGVITHVRVYRHSTATAANTEIALYVDGNETSIAYVAAAPFTGPGWNDLALSTPVAVTPGTKYMAAAFMAEGKYVYTSGAFNSQRTSGNLIGLATTDAVNGNGKFRTGLAYLSMPNQTFNATWYGIDVRFVPT